jgi:hypothetical protein
MGIGLGIAVFAGITVGGIDVAGIEVTAGAAVIAGAQAVTIRPTITTNKQSLR